jgi:tRNA (guanine37-N1)-methyltransferase
MIAARVEHSKAEKIRQKLMKNGLLDLDYQVKADSKFVFFPLTKKDPSLDIVEITFESSNRKTGLKDALKESLTSKELSQLTKSFDIVGSIAIIDVPEGMEKHEQLIAKSVMLMNKNVKTVLKKSDIHAGEFRTQKLKYVAGKKTKETIHKENNALMKLNVEKVYFSPRLSTERKRIMDLIKPNENVLVMFSGCAPYPLVIAKNTKVKEIIGIEKNPDAHKYAVENLILNKITNVKLFNSDVRDVMPLENKFDRIIMPLPKDADLFLDLALKSSKKGTLIHLYLFLDKDKFEEAERRVLDICKENDRKCKILDVVKCGQYSPTTFRVCIDLKVL